MDNQLHYKTYYLSKDRADFKEAIRRGLGRAYVMLQQKDKERFRDLVQWGCLNFCPNTFGANSTHEKYVYRLVKCYDDPESFVPLLAHKFLALDFEESSGEYEFFTHLLELFALDGSALAAETIETKYKLFVEHILKTKITQFNLESEYSTLFRILALALVFLKGENVFPTIATDIGKLSLEFRLDYWAFDEFYSRLYFNFHSLPNCLKNVYSREVDVFLSQYGQYVDYFQNDSHDDDEYGNDDECDEDCDVSNMDDDYDFYADFDLSKYKGKLDKKITEKMNGVLAMLCRKREVEDDGIDWKEKCKEENKFVSNAKMRSFEESAAELKELKKQSESVLDELKYARNSHNFDVERLVECLHNDDEKVVREAQSILDGVKSDRLIEYAKRRLAFAGPEYFSMSVLLKNYSESNKNLLMDMLHRLDDDPDDFDAGCLFSLIAQDESLPTEMLLFVYDNSFAPMDRINVLIQLVKRGELSEAIEKECWFDASPGVACFAKKHNFKKLK